MSDLDDHLSNANTRHRCNDHRGANNACSWCEENMAARAELTVLRAEHAAMRKLVLVWSGADGHGCLTGDCPHAKQTECVDAVCDYMRDSAKDARAVLGDQG